MATVLSVVLFCSRCSCFVFFSLCRACLGPAPSSSVGIYIDNCDSPTPFFCVCLLMASSITDSPLSLSPDCLLFDGLHFYFNTFFIRNGNRLIFLFSYFFFYQIKKGHPPPLLVSCATFNDWAGHLFFFLLKKIDGINPLLAIYNTLPPPAHTRRIDIAKWLFAWDPSFYLFLFFFSSWW